MNAPTAASVLASPVSSHRAFSLRRLWAIASNTLLELVRLKVFYFLLLFALLMIGSSLFTSTFTFQGEFQVLKDVSLGAMSIFSWLLAVLATAMLLPKDIEDRTLYTILAKPIPRFEYLLGKFIGILLLLALAALLMGAMACLVLYWRQQTAIAEVLTHPINVRAGEIQNIRSQTFDTNLLAAGVIVYVKAALCAALTLLVSTFASSSIFTIIVSATITLIGHIQPIARDAWLSSGTVSTPTRLFLGLIALVVPDLNALSLVDDLMLGHPLGWALFLQTAGLGGIYILFYWLLSYSIFATKEL